MTTHTLHEAIAWLRHATTVLAAERPDPLTEAEAAIPEGMLFKSAAGGEALTRNQYLTSAARRRSPFAEWVRYGDDLPTISRGAPTVVVGWPFGDLPARGWEGPEAMSAQGSPADQPAGEPLYAKALHVVSSDDPRPPDEDHLRVHRVAVLGDPTEAPPTIQGTQALVVAAVLCSDVADQLNAWSSTRRADQSRRFTAEATYLGRQADAYVAALPAALAWVEDFDAEHPQQRTNGHRVFPTVPTELRGTTEFRLHTK